MIRKTFKSVFLAVLGLTVLSLAVSVWLSSQNPMSTAQEKLFQIVTAAWQMGFLAILGLLSARGINRRGDS